MEMKRAIMEKKLPSSLDHSLAAPFFSRTLTCRSLDLSLSRRCVHGTTTMDTL